MADIAERLKRWRRAYALSQEQLAKKAGVNAATIVRIERGEVSPKPSTIRKLAKALKIEPWQLTGEERPQPPQITREWVEEHGINTSDAELEEANVILEDVWRGMRGELPRAHFIPDEVDVERVLMLLLYFQVRRNLFSPEELEAVRELLARVGR